MPQPSPESEARYVELNAVAMLAGEGGPLYCSLCMGKGIAKQFIGWCRCPQCGGVGFECLGPATKLYVENQYGR